MAGLPLAFLGACDDGTLEPDPDPGVDSIPGVVDEPVIPPVTVGGFVVDGSDSPVSGATVVAKNEDGDSLRAAVTNTQGEYDFGTSLTTFPVVLIATAEGFSTAVGYADVDSTGTADIPELRIRRQETTPVTVSPDSGGTVQTQAEGPEPVSVTVTVPAGAVTDTATITVAPVNPDGVPPDLTSDAVTVPLAAGVFGPDGTVFQTLISVTMQTADILNTNGYTVRAREYDEATGRWVPALLRDGSPVPVTVNGDGTLTLQVDHFSTYKAELAANQATSALSVSRTQTGTLPLGTFDEPGDYERTFAAEIGGTIRRVGTAQRLPATTTGAALSNAKASFSAQLSPDGNPPVPAGVLGTIQNDRVEFQRKFTVPARPTKESLGFPPEACGSWEYRNAVLNRWTYTIIISPTGNTGATRAEGDVVITVVDVPGPNRQGGEWVFLRRTCVTGSTG